MKDKIQESYWDHMLIEGSKPASVYALCKKYDIDEKEFYHHFNNTDGIESTFWQSTIDDTISLLERDNDYKEYDFQQKLFAFFYTYIVHIQPHRSRFVHHFPLRPSQGICNTKEMRNSFRKHIKTLIQQGLNEQSIADRKKLTELYDAGLFEHFKFIIGYYIKDNSPAFQDTDAFIEKSVGLFIESARGGVLDSAIDLVRFLSRHFTSTPDNS